MSFLPKLGLVEQNLFMPLAPGLTSNDDAAGGRLACTTKEPEQISPAIGGAER